MGDAIEYSTCDNCKARFSGPSPLPLRCGNCRGLEFEIVDASARITELEDELKEEIYARRLMGSVAQRKFAADETRIRELEAQAATYAEAWKNIPCLKCDGGGVHRCDRSDCLGLHRCEECDGSGNRNPPTDAGRALADELRLLRDVERAARLTDSAHVAGPLRELDRHRAQRQGGKP